MQGVTFLQSVQGLFRCQHCGVLLRVTNYGKHFWLFYIGTIAVLCGLVLAHPYIENIIRIDPGFLWVALFVSIIITFTFGMWRHANVKQVDDANPPGAA